MKKTIYRVEHNDKGVFQGGILYELVDEMGCLIDLYDVPLSPIRHPIPCYDEKLSHIWDNLSNRNEWYFGFSSKKSMYSWFDDYNIKVAMRRAGIQTVIYEGDEEDYREGSAQVIFRKSKSIKLSTELFKV